MVDQSPAPLVDYVMENMCLRPHITYENVDDSKKILRLIQ